MENNDLFFFCTMCRNKSKDEIADIKCSIPHTVKKYAKGEHIANQNDPINYLFMLTKGRVKTEIISSSGLTLSMEEISAPYPLAAAFLFADKHYFPVDVIALEECEVLLIKKENVEEYMEKCKGFLRGFLAFNANRMQYLSERLKIFAQKGIKAKLSYFILSKEKKGEFEFKRSITSLAEYFGVERPSLSRAISEMVKDKIITFNSGKGKILNYEKLQDILL